MREEIDVCESLEFHPEIIKEVRQDMPKDEVLENIADTFKIFGDKTRIRILFLLHANELCVCDIAQLLDMNQSAISHQLRLLKQAKLIKSRRDGKQMYYSLDDSHVRTILRMGMEHVQEE